MIGMKSNRNIEGRSNESIKRYISPKSCLSNEIFPSVGGYIFVPTPVN
jgi:hypothetical protein